MKNIKTGTYIYNDEAYEFGFATDLSVADKQRFVNSVVNLVVIDDDYHCIIRDLVFDFYTIEFFTDINMSELENSDFFVDDVEQFLNDTNIVDIVKANVSQDVFDELNKAVDMAIEYRTGIHRSPLGEAVANLINTFEKKINDIDLVEIMNVAKVFSGMTDKLTVEGIVNAYLNSDIHKQNLADIENSKNTI